MCNLSKLVEQEGIAKGRTEGLTEGILASIRNLMNSMGWTAQQAMEALKVPEEEQRQYLDRLVN